MSFTNIAHGFLVECDVNIKDGESINISKYITNVNIRRRFLQDSFPLFVVGMRTTEVIRDKIRDNECSLNLRIYYYNMNTTNNEEEADTNDVAPEGLVYEGNIRIYEKEFSTTVSKKDDDSSDETSQSDAAPFITYKVIGTPEDYISKNENIINTVYVDAAPIDAAVHILTSCGVGTPIIQKPDNTDTYKNIIIPPLNMIPALNLLQSQYGLYTEGISVFFDGDVTYCYSPLSEGVPSGNLLEISVLEPEANTTTKDTQTPKIDKDGNIKVSIRQLPTFIHNPKVSRHTVGSETIFYSYDDNFNLVTRSSSDDNSFKKTRYLWNKLGEKHFEDFTVEGTRKDSMMMLPVSSISPFLMNPLTTVRIISPKYNKADGDYNISEISTIIETTDFKHYRGSSIITTIKK